MVGVIDVRGLFSFDKDPFIEFRQLGICENGGGSGAESDVLCSDLDMLSGERKPHRFVRKRQRLTQRFPRRNAVALAALDGELAMRLAEALLSHRRHRRQRGEQADEGGREPNRPHLPPQKALGLARQGYRRPDRTVEIPVVGESGIAAIRTQLYNMKEGGFISEYDAYRRSF